MAINPLSAGLPGGTLVNGRFRIKKLLGQGGYGNVYLVEDETVFPGNQFALKESLSSTTSERRQFTREAKWLQDLEHPNLPRVIEQFEWNSRPYFAMAYISGENLEDRVDRLGPLPETQVLEWIRPIADAILYLHSQKRPIIHRDIKPGNIIVTKDGRPWLVDFGIAKVISPSVRSRKTTRAARAVSGGYSPLEQYTRGGTDARSDIYALGATLYHLLTGICPPEAPDLAAGVVQLPEPHLLTTNKISRQTEQAIMRAMRQKPEERFQSMRDFLDGLSGGSPASGGGAAAAAQPVPAPTASGKRNPKKAPAPAPDPVPVAAGPLPTPPPAPPAAAATFIGPAAGAPQYTPPPAWAVASPPPQGRVDTGTQAFGFPPPYSLPPGKQAGANKGRIVLAGIVALLCGLGVLGSIVLTIAALQGNASPGFVPRYDLMAGESWWLTALLVLSTFAALLLIIVPFFHWFGMAARLLTYLLLGLLPLVGLAPVIAWIASGGAEIGTAIFADGLYLPCLLFGLSFGVTIAQMLRGK